jgi:hypothetical protein
MISGTLCILVPLLAERDFGQLIAVMRSAVLIDAAAVASVLALMGLMAVEDEADSLDGYSTGAPVIAFDGGGSAAQDAVVVALPVKP